MSEERMTKSTTSGIHDPRAVKVSSSDATLKRQRCWECFGRGHKDKKPCMNCNARGATFVPNTSRNRRRIMTASAVAVGALLASGIQALGLGL